MPGKRPRIAALLVALLTGCAPTEERFPPVALAPTKPRVQTRTANPPRKLPPTVMAALEDAEKFELLSLEPDEEKVHRPNSLPNWKVLGKTTIKDPATRKKLIDSLERGVEEDQFFAGAGCFSPRHGLHVVSRGKTTDIVICFECVKAYVYANGESTDGFLTTGSPQTDFDAVLRQAGVRLAAER